jgi:hypothetical protein
MARWVVAVALVTAACRGDDSQSVQGSFDLQGAEVDGEWPDAEPLSAEVARLAAVVVEAPKVVTAGDEAVVVIELRNPSNTSVRLDPCPTWVAWLEGENTGIATTLSGNLPCGELRRVDAGDRVRLRLAIPAPHEVDCHDGYDPDFGWQLLDGDESRVGTSVIGIPMRESDSSPPNDCGAGRALYPDPPGMERT